MRTGIFVVGLLGSLTLFPAGAKTDDKLDYTELSKLIHQGVVAQVPKEFEDRAEWGKSIPLTTDLRFPRLQRVRIKVGDREEFPHGLWKRTRVWLDEPAKDLQIQVRDFKAVEGGKFQLGVDVKVALHGEREWKPWQKGLALPGLTVKADARLLLALDCEAAVSFDFTKLPPDIKVKPKILKSRLDLQEFDLLQIGNKLLSIEGDRAREIGVELKDFLQQYIRSQEPQIQEELNQALAKSVLDGKGSFSGANLIKLLNPSKSDK